MLTPRLHVRSRMGRPDIEENIPFQERTWLVQRIAWVVGAAVVLAAFAGVLGAGPATRSVIELPGGGEVRYSRVLRNDSRSELVVRVPPGNGPLQLFLDQDFLDGAEIERLDPEPMRIAFDHGGWLLLYERREASSAAVRVTFRPRRPGALNAQISLNAASGAGIRLFVLP